MRNLDLVVIIPALNPKRTLINYTEELLAEGIAHVIIVNDGSNPSTDYIFKALANLEKCTVLYHSQNRGKGRALKTAFQYYLETFPSYRGVVTADADGQHSINDVLKIAETVERNKKELILGIRDFQLEDVPPKSRYGNNLTTMFFKLLYRRTLVDTQTGLRGIPTAVLPLFASLKGERYEYEMNMLIQAVKQKVNIAEVDIQTIYFEKNSGSYYKAIRDSVKILKQLISGLFRKKSNYGVTESGSNGK